MNERRKADPALDEKFCERRKDRVQGTGLFKDEARESGKATKKRVVSEKEQTYDDEHVAGTFYPLEDFARQRGLGHMTFHPLTEHIETVLKMKVVQNRYDVWGVEVYDLNDGAYRFHRGLRDVAEKSKDEIHASKAKDHISDFQYLLMLLEFYTTRDWV